MWTDFAVQDLTKLREYIAKDSIKNANIMFEEILISTKDLSRFPKKGRVIPNINKDFYREYFVSTFRVMYKIEEESVFIAGVFHMSRDFKSNDLLERK